MYKIHLHHQNKNYYSRVSMDFIVIQVNVN